MGSMTDEEYTNQFLELLRYMPYMEVEKVKIHIFINGLSVAFKERIEFDQPRSLEEAIKKLKHCYEKSKCRSESEQDWKGNKKNKRKWDKKRTRPQDIGNKENTAPPKNFNASNTGQGFQFEEQNKDDGRKPL